jgi:putative transposase
VKYQAIHEHRGRFATRWMCRQLKVSASGFYAWRQRAPAPRAVRDEQLKVLIRASYAAGRKTYGSPRIYRDLKAQGQCVGRKRVARLMAQEGLAGLRKRRFCRTTDSAHDLPLASNALNRQFKPSAPNAAWAGDITYLRTPTGWLYLAIVMDLFSRKIVGWAIADHMRTELVTRALDLAVQQRQPAEGLLHHSDRGSQYASHHFQGVLKNHGITCSMSRKAECWDNAVVESFFGTMKEELVYRRSWGSDAELRAAVAEYITCFYNAKRLHSTLGYVSPMEYEEEAQRLLVAA